MSAVISLFPRASARRVGWSQQELAEFYRVEAALVRAGLRIASEQGLSDEGEPWFAFCRPDGDEIMHFARIDGSYLIASAALDRPARGQDFRDLINQVARNHPELLPIPRAGEGARLSVHPAALLAALVAAAALMLSPDDAFAGEGERPIPTDTPGETAARDARPSAPEAGGAVASETRDGHRKHADAILLSAMIFAANAFDADPAESSAGPGLPAGSANDGGAGSQGEASPGHGVEGSERVATSGAALPPGSIGPLGSGAQVSTTEAAGSIGVHQDHVDLGRDPGRESGKDLGRDLGTGSGSGDRGHAAPAGDHLSTASQAQNPASEGEIAHRAASPQPAGTGSESAGTSAAAADEIGAGTASPASVSAAFDGYASARFPAARDADPGRGQEAASKTHAHPEGETATSASAETGRHGSRSGTQAPASEADTPSGPAEHESEKALGQDAGKGAGKDAGKNAHPEKATDQADPGAPSHGSAPADDASDPTGPSKHGESQAASGSGRGSDAHDAAPAANAGSGHETAEAGGAQGHGSAKDAATADPETASNGQSDAADRGHAEKGADPAHATSSSGHATHAAGQSAGAGDTAAKSGAPSHGPHDAAVDPAPTDRAQASSEPGTGHVRSSAGTSPTAQEHDGGSGSGAGASQGEHSARSAHAGPAADSTLPPPDAEAPGPAHTRSAAPAESAHHGSLDGTTGSAALPTTHNSASAEAPSSNQAAHSNTTKPLAGSIDEGGNLVFSSSAPHAADAPAHVPAADHAPATVGLVGVQDHAVPHHFDFHA